MWTVAQPDRSAVEVARLCARGVRSADFRRRTVDSLAAFESNSAFYQSQAARSACHTLPTSTDLAAPSVTDEEMKTLYSGQLARPSSPASAAYNEIMGNAPGGLCSYCQYGVATTLDHFVPKSTAPALSIEPWNLIPSCKDCNHRMGNAFSTTTDDEFLHPYYMPYVGRWLRSSIDHSSPVVAVFYAEPSADVDVDVRARIAKQFDELHLAALYSVVAAGDLVETAAAAEDIWDSSGPDGVQAHLGEMAERAAAVSVNSRRSVLFEALSNDEWYYNGGFFNT